MKELLRKIFALNQHASNFVRDIGGPSINSGLDEHPDSVNGVRYAVDSFPKGSCEKLFRVSGWFLSDEPRDWSVTLFLDGEPVANMQRVYRHDVATAYPNHPQAVRSGFLGDYVLPAEFPRGKLIVLTLVAWSKTKSMVLADERVVMMSNADLPIRCRDFEWSGLLLGHPDLIIAGVPHFHPPNHLPVIRLMEPDATHPYGTLARELIDSNHLVLDFGAGIQSPDRLRNHVVNLDAIHFPWTDVVCTRSTLPFHDAVFDAVVSQAVFEHVADPFQSAREIFRILKPGGTVLIDTAFMQPFHGDPDHYFNMTLSGLKRVMSDFEVIKSGVQPWQTPHWGLKMQIESVLPLMPSGVWRKRLQRALLLLQEEGDVLDAELGLVGSEVLAAGVYVLAQKPLLK